MYRRNVKSRGNSDDLPKGRKARNNLEETNSPELFVVVE
jgi:hypothetical protein